MYKNRRLTNNILEMEKKFNKLRGEYKNPNKDNEGSGYSKLPKKNVMYSLDTFIKNSNEII